MSNPQDDREEDQYRVVKEAAKRIPPGLFRREEEAAMLFNIGYIRDISATNKDQSKPTEPSEPPEGIIPVKRKFKRSIRIEDEKKGPAI